MIDHFPYAVMSDTVDRLRSFVVINQYQFDAGLLQEIVFGNETDEFFIIVDNRKTAARRFLNERPYLRNGIFRMHGRNVGVGHNRNGSRIRNKHRRRRRRIGTDDNRHSPFFGSFTQFFFQRLSERNDKELDARVDRRALYVFPVAGNDDGIFAVVFGKRIRKSFKRRSADEYRRFEHIVFIFDDNRLRVYRVRDERNARRQNGFIFGIQNGKHVLRKYIVMEHCHIRALFVDDRQHAAFEPVHNADGIPHRFVFSDRIAQTAHKIRDFRNDVGDIFRIGYFKTVEYVFRLRRKMPRSARDIILFAEQLL